MRTGSVVPLTEQPRIDDPDAFPLGIVVPLTGGHGSTGLSISRGALLAIDEVNAAGGIAGRPIRPVVRDSTTSVSTAVGEVRTVLRDERVGVCVAAYTSAGRVAMIPAFREHDALLLYPTYYEGLEDDPNVFYAGAVPNQFLDGYLGWVLERLGRRWYVIGSDYVYPRTAAQYVQRYAAQHGASVVADRYVPLGQVNFASVIDEIAATKPDVIVCNLVGNDSVPAFYREFHAAGFRASELPIAATVTSEVELQMMDPVVAEGHYMVASYFASLRNPANETHRAAFEHRFGPGAAMQVVSTAAYNAVWLLADAGAQARELSVPALRAALPAATFDGNPEGHPIAVRANHHTTHGAYIGVAGPGGQYEVVETMPVREPDPYPALLVPPERRPPAPVASEVGSD